jgi:MFS family permease
MTSAAGRVDWRRNLAALWVAMAASVLGITFTYPFMPLFINRDLGVHDPHQLAFWTGLATGGTGIGLAISSPIWGALADRYGRKPMLIRALVCGAVVMVCISLVQSALQLALARVLYGALAGTLPIAISLASRETPRSRIGWSIGVIWSAVALGSAIGPLLGGLAVAAFGLRWMYAAGGAVIGATSIPVWLLVRESRRKRKQRSSGGVIAELRSHPGTLATIGGLMVAQTFVQMIGGGSQPMFALRLLHLAPEKAAFWTGVAFAAAGLGTAISAGTYAGLAGRIGYRVTVLIAALAASAIIFTGASVTTVGLVVACVALFGLFQGALNPAVSSMIGMETPSRVQATVFGFMSTAFALGITLGPLLSGVVAATSDASAALYVASGMAVVLFVLVLFGVREPAPGDEEEEEEADEHGEVVGLEAVEAR